MPDSPRDAQLTGLAAEISSAELEQQSATELPNREAMSLINTAPSILPAYADAADPGLLEGTPTQNTAPTPDLGGDQLAGAVEEDRSTQLTQSDSAVDQT